MNELQIVDEAKYFDAVPLIKNKVASDTVFSKSTRVKVKNFEIHKYYESLT